MNPRAVFNVLKDTYSEWSRHNASTLAAALAYYAIFSIGPLLLITISIAGLVYGQKAAQGQIVGQIQGVVGPQAADVIQGLLQAANRRESGIIGTVIGVVTLLLGAAGLFGQLQSSLNVVWGVKARSSGIRGMARQRALTFLMVLGMGILLLLLLVVGTALAAIVAFFGSLLPANLGGFLLQTVDFVVSFAVITLVFAAIFRVLPDTTVAWRDVWLGAVFTALLFTVGKLGLSFYLGRASVGSTFGAAGSLVVLLVWIYYSAQIFFFGAEFTQVYANRYGPGHAPAENVAGQAANETAPDNGTQISGSQQAEKEKGQEGRAA